jgi:hypothetical protein
VTWSPLLETRRFSFELTVNITSSLSIAAGELSELLLDGIFALDEEGILFPGVTIPGNGDRLVEASIRLAGYARPAELTDPGTAYRALMAGKGRRPSQANDELGERLRNAAAELHAGVLRQRMLIARLRALGGEIGGAGPVADMDPVVAEALITAANSVTAAVDAAIMPVL